jgi:hypothetical protein
VLLPSELPLLEHITRRAADTIPTRLATRALVVVIERSVTAALIAAAEPVSAAELATLRAGAARVHRLEIVLNPSRTMSGWGRSKADLGVKRRPRLFRAQQRTLKPHVM